MRSTDPKVAKYVARINELLTRGRAPATDIMSLHGNSNVAANVAPFGCPLLAALSALAIGRKNAKVILGNLALLCLRIRKQMPTANRGLFTTTTSFLGNYQKLNRPFMLMLRRNGVLVDTKIIFTSVTRGRDYRNLLGN